MQPVAEEALPTQGSGGARAGFLWAAVALLAAAVAMEWPYVWVERVPAGLDGLRMSLPQRYFLHQAVADGEFPLWNPFEAMGLPWLAQLAPGLLHPLNVLAAFIDPVPAFAWNHFGAVLLAAFGAFGLAASRGLGPVGALVAGVGFGLSGAIVTQANLHYLVSNATVPWVLWAADRLRLRPGPMTLLATGSAMALVLFGGDVQGLFVAVGLAALGTTLGERRAAALGWFALAGVAALGLAAVQLWPSLEALAGSGRLSTDLSMRHRWNVGFTAWPELLFQLPGAATVPTSAREALGLEAMPWIERPGVGLVLVALVVAGVGRSARARLDALAGALLLWLAFGPGTGAWDVAGRLPLWRSFQYPEKMLPFATLCFALTAAAGASALVSEGVARRRMAWVAGGMGVVAAGAWVACVTGVSPWPAEWAAATADAWAVSAGVAALVLLLVPRLGGRPVALALVVVGGMLLPAFTLAGRLGYSLEASHAALPPWAAGEIMRLHHEPHPPRTVAVDTEGASGGVTPVSSRNVLAFGFALQFGIESIRPYHPFSSRGHAELCLDPGDHGLWCTRIEGVEFALRPSTDVLPAGFESVGHNPGGEIELLRVRAPVPRARLAAGVVRVGDFEAALARTRLLKVTPLESVVVEEDGAPAETAAGGTVQYAGWTPNTVRLFVQATGRAFVVLNESWDAGWVARVDGEEVPVRRVNALARGVWVDGGEHVVDFSYEPASVRYGATISGLTAVLLLLAEVVRRRRRAGN